MVFTQNQRPGYSSDYGTVIGFNDLPDMYMPEERPLSLYQSNRAAAQITAAEVSAAITAAGSRPTRFLIDKDINLNANVSYDKHITFEVINGKKIIASNTTVSWEMNGVGITSFRRQQIFQGFGRTKARWIGNYPDAAYPEWFGVVSNVDSTVQRDANDIAIATCLEAFQSDLSRGNTPSASSAPYFTITAGKVLFGNAAYYFNKPITNNAGIEIDSIGGAILFGGTDKVVLRLNGNLTRGEVTPFDDVSSNNYGEYSTTSASFVSSQTSNPITITLPTALPKNLFGGWCWLQGGTGNLPAGQSCGGNITSVSSDGLTITVNVINRHWDSNPTHSWELPAINATTPLPAFSGATFKAIANRGNSDFLPRVKNIELRGSKSVGVTHTVTIDGENINWVSGEKFDMDNRYFLGVTFTHEGITYLVGNHPTNPQPDNQMKLRRLRLRCARTGANTYFIQNVPFSGSSRWIGATIVHRETRRQHTITNFSGGLITIDGVDEAEGEFWLTALPVANYTNVQIQVHNKSIGLDPRIHFYAENVTIRYCDVGLAMDSIIKPSIGPRINVSQPNQNNSRVTDCRMFENKTGMYARAVNANNTIFMNCDYQNNYVQMIDECQHANSHYSMHGQGNNQGIIAGFTSIQGSTFFDPYLEDDQLHFDCDAKVTIWGGGASVSAIAQTGATLLYPDPLAALWTGSAYEAVHRNTANPGNGNQTYRKQVTRLGDSFWKHFLSFGEKSGQDFKKSWHLTFENLGYYSFQYDEDSGAGGQIAWTWNPAMEFTTSEAAEGGGQLILSKGMYIRNKINTSRPAASAALRGRIWIDNATGGQPDKMFWCRLAANGTDYEWKEIAFV